VLVAEYRISDRAKADLLDVYEFTDGKFGRYQAEAYHAGFERTFGLLAEFPGIGLDSSELAGGHRRFRFQSHVNFYTEEPDHILIRALIRVRQNLRPALFT
jgi:toxin ParE1/3/4